MTYDDLKQIYTQLKICQTDMVHTHHIVGVTDNIEKNMKSSIKIVTRKSNCWNMFTIELLKGEIYISKRRRLHYETTNRCCCCCSKAYDSNIELYTLV